MEPTGSHWDLVDCDDRIDIPSYHLSLHNLPHILSGKYPVILDTRVIASEELNIIYKRDALRR